MLQSKKQSILESFIQTTIGIILSFFIQLIIYPILNIIVTFTQNIIISIIFFIVSIFRNYVIRRIFNNKQRNNENSK
jgi:hypothetical protein